MRDHYETLGVHPGAGAAEVRAAYLRVMRANHPDRRPADPAAAARARQANAAWHVLGDRARRSAYDRLRHARLYGVPDVSAPDHTALLRAEAASRRAYSEDRFDYRDALTRACLRGGVAVLVLGIAMLFAVGGA